MPQSFHPELQYRIALSMAPAIGPIKAKALIKHFESAKAVFMEKKANLMKIDGIGTLISESIASTHLMEDAEKEMQFMSRHRISACYYKDSDYPERLKECEDGPLLLYRMGDKGFLAQRTLSVVGTRRATSYGKDLCREIVSGLGGLFDDLVIVSGLAFGIDVIAHRAALESGIPTVAILGHGLSTIYPHAHRDTARKIAELGTLATDFHSKMGPERNNFIRRNRIIAGLSEATLVIESAEKGGALITAGMASSYHRDVLAVPGRAGDERSKGCNGLIKSNLAALVESPEDVIDHLNWEEHTRLIEHLPVPDLLPSENERLILQLIQDLTGICPGTISNKTGLPIHRVLAILMEMELKQWVSVEPGNRYRIRIHIP